MANGQSLDALLENLADDRGLVAPPPLPPGTEELAEPLFEFRPERAATVARTVGDFAAGFGTALAPGVREVAAFRFLAPIIAETAADIAAEKVFRPLGLEERTPAEAQRERLFAGGLSGVLGLPPLVGRILSSGAEQIARITGVPGQVVERARLRPVASEFGQQAKRTVSVEELEDELAHAIFLTEREASERFEKFLPENIADNFTITSTQDAVDAAVSTGISDDALQLAQDILGDAPDRDGLIRFIGENINQKIAGVELGTKRIEIFSSPGDRGKEALELAEFGAVDDAAEQLLGPAVNKAKSIISDISNAESPLELLRVRQRIDKITRDSTEASVILRPIRDAVTEALYMVAPGVREADVAFSHLKDSANVVRRFGQSMDNPSVVKAKRVREVAPGFDGRRAVVNLPVQPTQSIDDQITVGALDTVLGVGGTNFAAAAPFLDAVAGRLGARQAVSSIGTVTGRSTAARAAEQATVSRETPTGPIIQLLSLGGLTPRAAMRGIESGRRTRQVVEASGIPPTAIPAIRPAAAGAVRLPVNFGENGEPLTFQGLQ